MIFKSGATSQSVDVQIVDDNGLAVTGLTYSTAPTIKYSLGGANADATISLVTLATVTTAWVSGGFIERGNGVYRLDVPNAALSSVGEVTLRAEASGQHLVCPRLMVVAFDPTSSTNMGLSALPTANPAANGGLPTCDANNSVRSNVLPNGYGTATAGGSSTITLQTALGANLRGYANTITIISGTGAGQSRVIVNYVDSTKVATTDRAWETNPSTDSVYIIIGISVPAIAVPSSLGAIYNVSSTVNAYVSAVGSQASLFFGNPKTLILSGSITPAFSSYLFFVNSTGNATYGGKAAYQNAYGQWIWWDSTNTLWTISNTLGTRGAGYLTSSTLAGPYTAGGTWTGTPSISSLGAPLDENWGNAKFDSNGSIYSNLQSVLSNAVTVDANNYLNVNVKDIAGVAAVLDANNYLKVDVEDIRGSASQGAVGYVGIDQSKITNATATVALTNTTVGNATNLTNAGPDTSGTTTLLGRVTSSRASYLDNLNVGGNVASHADVLAINTSSSKHILLSTVGQYAPSEAYTIECRTFSAADGSSVNADSNPTLTVAGSVSGSLAANLGSITNPATGVYRWTYTVPSSPTLEQIRVDVSATISSATFTLSAYTQTVDSPTAVITQTIVNQITSIYNKLPVNNIADETLVLAAIGLPMQAGTTVTTNDATSIAAIKAKTDLIGANAGDSANTVTEQGNITTILSDVSGGTLATAANVTASTSAIESAITSGLAGLGANITVVSPMSSDGTELTITQGDSYTSALGNSISFTITNQAGLIGTVPHLRIAGVSSDLSVAPTITSGSQGVTFNDIAATSTSALNIGTYRYQIRFMNGSNVVTLIQGNVIIKGGY